MKSFESPTEASSESDSKSDGSSSSKSKKYQNKIIIGSVTAKQAVEAPTELKTDLKSQCAESIWQRLVSGQETKVADNQNHIEKPTVEKPSVDAAEDIKSLETLSEAESQETVAQFTASQKEVLQERLNSPEGTLEDKVKDQADLALLRQIDQEMAADPNRTTLEILHVAETSVTDQLETEPKTETETKNYGGSEGIDDETADPPIAAASGGAGGGGLPPRSGTAIPGGPGGPTGPLPPHGMRGGPMPGNPNMQMMSNGAPVPPASIYNAAPATANRAQDIGAERRAMAKGVLAGGIVGYLVGKRRGRIKTEKALLPIQKKLEKQVAALHETVRAGEERVRKLASEKVKRLSTEQTRSQFTERLASAGRVQERERKPFVPGPIEAPAVILGAAAALRAELPHRTEQAKPAVNFEKRVEAYTPAELNRATEKIKIDGTTLKELAQAHDLDKKAVKRVVRAFVEGGNVKEILMREMVEKEVKFERDPRFRRQNAGGGAQGGGTAANDAVPINDADGNVVFPAGAAVRSDPELAGKQPEPDQATLDRLRRQQTTQLAVGSVGVTAIIVLLIALLV